MLTEKRKQLLKEKSADLLTTLITTNIIRKNNQHYKLLKTTYPVFREQLYNDLGLTLVEIEDGFKLLTKDNQEALFTSPFEYGLYFLIASSFITTDKGEAITQEALSDQVLSQATRFESNAMNKETSFLKVLRTLITQGYLEKNYHYENGLKISLISKKKNLPLYVEEIKEPKTPLTKALQLLLTHTFVDKRDYPDVFRNISHEDLRIRLSKYQTDESGYELYVYGNTLRLLSKNDHQGFPKTVDSHLTAIDILEKMKDNELTELLSQSKYAGKTTTCEKVQETIDHYGLNYMDIQIQN